MRLENPLILPITGKLDQSQGLQTLGTCLASALKVQSLSLKNFETVSYLSLLFENKVKIRCTGIDF